MSLEISWDNRWTIFKLYPQKHNFERRPFAQNVKVSFRIFQVVVSPKVIASSTYVWSEWKPLYVNTNIDEIYILEMWEFGDILNDSWTFIKLYSQKNDFWTPDSVLMHNTRSDNRQSMVDTAVLFWCFSSWMFFQGIPSFSNNIHPPKIYTLTCALYTVSRFILCLKCGNTYSQIHSVALDQIHSYFLM